MSRWVIYIKGGRGFATRTHILLDEDTRPMVFTNLQSAKQEADKHPGSWIEQEPDADGSKGRRVSRKEPPSKPVEDADEEFQLV